MGELTPYFQGGGVTLYLGDALDVARRLPGGSVDCIATSPPYYCHRDYGCPGQYGLESTPAEYVATLRAVFAELFRVLADEGTLWLSLGDTYVRKRDAARWGIPAKNMLGLPWRVAFALQDDGWVLRNAVIWHKTRLMPESIKDRLSNRYEHVFMFCKSVWWEGTRVAARRRVPAQYWFDLDAVRVPHKDAGQVRAREGRAQPGSTARAGFGYPAGTAQRLRREQMYHPGGANPGDVWELPTGNAAAHVAVFPIELPARAVAAGCRPGGVVLDPFSGSGTTGAAAVRGGRRYVGVDINSEFHELALRTWLSPDC